MMTYNNLLKNIDSISYSTELEIFIESIKVALFDKPKERLLFLLENKTINWQRFEQMWSYHALRPVVYSAFTKVDFQHKILEKLRLYSFEQAVVNLQLYNELPHLLRLLSKNGIKALPYKGILFVEKLYQNQPLREFGDVDILVHKKGAQKALQLLFADGYTLAKEVRVSGTTEAEITEILEFQCNEVGLDKSPIHIDFHWQIFEDYRHFKITTDEILSGSVLVKNEYYEPTTETLFLMILIHHGGRDCWLKLKHLADLAMFITLYQHQIDWHKMFVHLEEIQLKTSTLHGLILVQSIFKIDFCPKLQQICSQATYNEALIKKIVAYWEYAGDMVRLRSKMQYNYIYWLLQDANFSMPKHLWSYFKNHAYPNPIEEKRLIIFSKKHPILNFFGKVLSILVRRFHTRFL